MNTRSFSKEFPNGYLWISMLLLAVFICFANVYKSYAALLTSEKLEKSKLVRLDAGLNDTSRLKLHDAKFISAITAHHVKSRRAGIYYFPEVQYSILEFEKFKPKLLGPELLKVEPEPEIRIQDWMLSPDIFSPVPKPVK